MTPTPPQKFAQRNQLANTKSLTKGGVIANALQRFHPPGSPVAHGGDPLVLASL